MWVLSILATVVAIVVVVVDFGYSCEFYGFVSSSRGGG